MSRKGVRTAAGFLRDVPAASGVAAIMPPLPPAAGKQQVLGIRDDLPMVVEVDVKRIRPNPNQPRKVFRDEAIESLAQSIREKGLLQPIVVMEDPDNEDVAIIIAGERRLRACEHIGWETIPVIFHKGDPAELALVENLQRVDLDPFELAEGLRVLTKDRGQSQEYVAQLIGRSQPVVSRLIKLCTLSAEIVAEYRQMDDRPAASLLLEVSAAPEQYHRALWDKVKAGANKLTIRQMRAALEAGGAGPADPEKMARPAAKAITGLRRNLAALAQVNSRLSEDDITALRQAKAEIDRLLARSEQESG